MKSSGPPKRRSRATDLSPEHFARLTQLQESLLSALALGALRPQRYSGGYVPARELPAILRAFPVEPAAIRKLIARARIAIPKRLPGLAIQNRSMSGPLLIRLVLQGPRSASATRSPALPPVVLATLRAWFSATGSALLKPHALNQGPPFAESQYLSWPVVEELAARADFGSGRFDSALLQLDDVMSHIGEGPKQISLTLLRCEILLRRNRTDDFRTAGALLDSLPTACPPNADLDQLVLLALTFLTHAHWLYRDQIEYMYDDGLPQRIAQCREWLRHATDLKDNLLPRDQARLIQLKAVLLLKEARFADEQAMAPALLTQAEALLQDSLRTWHIAGDYLGIQENLHYLAEVLYTRAVKGVAGTTPLSGDALHEVYMLCGYTSALPISFADGINCARRACLIALEGRRSSGLYGADAAHSQFEMAIRLLGAASVLARESEHTEILRAAHFIYEELAEAGIRGERVWPWLYLRDKKEGLVVMYQALFERSLKRLKWVVEHPPKELAGEP